MSELFVGTISGTSIDGIDVVLADFSRDKPKIIAASTYAYSPSLTNQLQALLTGKAIDWQAYGSLDVALGRAFADAILALLSEAKIAPRKIVAIGHHGQTIYHQPAGEHPFSLQIADPNTVAANTGITTVADFRRLDMAFGGQGAPLVPALHDWLFRNDAETRVILNIGGIANITVLQPGEATTGFDTGPGNTLLDAWIHDIRQQKFDTNGEWAKSGGVNTALLTSLSSDSYFFASAPKSTGREYFNLSWLRRYLDLQSQSLSPQDVQATLSELTAATITDAIHAAAPDCQRVLVCGGGAHNSDLLNRLHHRLGYKPETTDALGIDPDWIEALTFAWFARARLRNEPTNVPSVTGARRAVTLGGIYSSGDT